MTYVHGQWNAICDRCGMKYKSGQIREEWTGLRVCCGDGTNNCFEERHPQDHVRAKADRQKTPWSRPEGPDVFVSPGDVTPEDL